MPLLMKAFEAFEQAPGPVKGLLEMVVKEVGQKPEVLNDVANAVNQIAAAKNMDVKTLLSSGALVRAVMEKLQSGVIHPERKQHSLLNVQCRHCGEINYFLETTHVRQEPENHRG